MSCRALCIPYIIPAVLDNRVIPHNMIMVCLLVSTVSPADSGVVTIIRFLRGGDNITFF